MLKLCNSTLLVSWLDSGNSWLYQLLETATEMYTGSYKDCDLAYINASMDAWWSSWFSECDSSEFHVGLYPKFHFKKVIYIIWISYNAFIADYWRDVISIDPPKSHINQFVLINVVH